MRLILSTIFLFLGAVMYLLPVLTRRGILFAVPLPPGFRESPTARQSISTFHAVVACATVLGIGAILFAPEPFWSSIAIAGPIGILAAAAVGFSWQYRKLTPFAVQPSLRTREVDLGRGPERVPWFTWLGGVPFAVVALAAMYLRANWNRIPAYFPVHWGVVGQPDRWSERDFHGVYGVLIFDAVFCAWLLVAALAMWFGARRSRMRRISMGAMIAAECIFGLMFPTIAVSPVLDIPIWIPVLIPLIVFVPLLGFLANRIHEDNEAPEPTPNDRWTGGLIYYNPDDSALMVQKRTGLGYTFNFGNPWSWALSMGLLLVVGSVFFLM